MSAIFLSCVCLSYFFFFLFLFFLFFWFFFFPLNWITVCMDVIIHYVNAFVIQPKDNFINIFFPLFFLSFFLHQCGLCELVCVIICWLAHLGRVMRPNWHSECTEYAHRSLLLLTTLRKIRNEFFVKTTTSTDILAKFNIQISSTGNINIKYSYKSMFSIARSSLLFRLVNSIDPILGYGTAAWMKNDSNVNDYFASLPSKMIGFLFLVKRGQMDFFHFVFPVLFTLPLLWPVRWSMKVLILPLNWMSFVLFHFSGSFGFPKWYSIKKIVRDCCDCCFCYEF